MFRRNKKTRRYQAPSAAVTLMAFERNFCDSQRFNAQVDELHNINKEAADHPESAEPLYFEF